MRTRTGRPGRDPSDPNFSTVTLRGQFTARRAPLRPVLHKRRAATAGQLRYLCEIADRDSLRAELAGLTDEEAFAVEFSRALAKDNEAGVIQPPLMLRGAA